MLLQGCPLEQVKRHPEAWQVPEPEEGDSSWLDVPLLKHLTPSDGDDDQVLDAVRKLSEVYTYSVDHIQHTTDLVLTLFDELAPLHRLGPKERFWLRCAALLHDIGKPQGNKGHHKTARDIILETPHLPFEQPERKIIASIARYHRRAWPKDKHDLFSSLSPVHQRAVIILASILRVGDGLDSPHRGNVESLSCRFSPDEITIKCMVKKKAKKERKRALQKGKLLEFAFERKLFIQWHRA
jgi:exopolyphosphatase/pppGpp-phosphohydrolase